MEESEGEDGENHDDEGGHGSSGTSDSRKKKWVRSGTDGRQGNRQSRSSRGGSGVRGTVRATSHSLDFMDEEEEMEAKFIDVFECLCCLGENCEIYFNTRKLIKNQTKSNIC